MPPMIWRAIALVALLTACGPTVTGPAAIPPRQAAPVYLYGDSLTVYARPYLTPGAAVFAQEGSAPCNHFKHMRSVARTSPTTVVIAFVTNTAPCQVGATRYAKYLNDLVTIRSIFPLTTNVIVVLPPATVAPAGPNADVVQAVVASGLPTIDGRTPLTGYPRQDGVHLTTEGNQQYARVLSSAWT